MKREKQRIEESEEDRERKDEEGLEFDTCPYLHNDEHVKSKYENYSKEIEMFSNSQ